MHGRTKPRIRRVKPGTALVRQGEPGTEIHLLLDEVVPIERDGERLAEYGHGAMLGERAGPGGRPHLFGDCRHRMPVALANASQFDQAALEELAGSHQREGATQCPSLRR